MSLRYFVMIEESRKQKNGIDERGNISIMECARTLMMEKNAAVKY